jgi:methionyl-tRNA formyltransferase
MKDRLKVILMGTPEFAVPFLRAIHNGPDELLLVVTQPDRPKGRGYLCQPPPMKQEALALGYKVLQPEKLSESWFLDELNNLAVDVICVVAYGSFLPLNLLNLPKLACVNVHPSLLPKYRGAAPIQRAIINGESVTGVTTMHMAEGMDSGDLILQTTVEINPNETAGELHDRLALIGAELLLDTLSLLKTGKAPRISQKQEEATFAGKIHPQEGQIDWSQSAQAIHNLARGLLPKPGAYFFYNQHRIKVAGSALGEECQSHSPGSVLKTDEDYLQIGTGKGSINLYRVQPENSKVMTAKEFINGYRLKVGSILE